MLQSEETRINFRPELSKRITIEMHANLSTQFRTNSTLWPVWIGLFLFSPPPFLDIMRPQVYSPYSGLRIFQLFFRHRTLFFVFPLYAAVNGVVSAVVDANQGLHFILEVLNVSQVSLRILWIIQRQLPKIRISKKRNSGFFPSKTCIVDQLWHFCSHL